MLDKDASSRLSLTTSPSKIPESEPVPTSSEAPPPALDPHSDISRRRPPDSKSLKSEGSKPARDPPTYEQMILDSTPYLCAIPPPPPTPTPNANATLRDHEAETAELARATDRGWDLLQDMSGQCLYFISGWWSYQFCYSQSVKQFHPLPPGGNVPLFPPVEDPTTPTYVLGRFGEKKINRHRLPANGGEGGAIDGGLAPEDGEGSSTTIQAKGTPSSRYLSQKLTGGTVCDLTGAPRRIEVQFHCHQHGADRIGYIKETSTCSYLMVIHTPRLCNDVAFLPEQEEQADQVVCTEVISESEIPAWRRRKSQEAERLLFGTIEKTVNTALKQGDSGTAPKQMVGGIEVGAMKLVGGDKGWLKLPERHPGQEVTIGKDGKAVPKGQAIAHQHKKEEGGAVHRLKDKEMRDLGVDTKMADAAIKELQAMSGGKGWKLEVFWKEGKLEMRGMINEGGEGGGDTVDFQGVDIIVVDGDGEEIGEEEWEDEAEYGDEL